MKRPLFLLLALVGTLLATSSCQTTSPSAAQKAQLEKIMQEPAGDYWVGRRFHWQGTRVWGYVRRPKQGWDTSRLAVMDERYKRQADRVPERPATGPAHGFDHNFEYRLRGELLTSRDDLTYDPNANLELPTFVLRSQTLISDSPGFVFKPGDNKNQRRLPRGF